MKEYYYDEELDILDNLETLEGNELLEYIFSDNIMSRMVGDDNFKIVVNCYVPKNNEWSFYTVITYDGEVFISIDDKNAESGFDYALMIEKYYDVDNFAVKMYN